MLKYSGTKLSLLLSVIIIIIITLLFLMLLLLCCCCVVVVVLLLCCCCCVVVVVVVDCHSPSFVITIKLIFIVFKEIVSWCSSYFGCSYNNNYC